MCSYEFSHVKVFQCDLNMDLPPGLMPQRLMEGHSWEFVWQSQRIPLSVKQSADAETAPDYRLVEPGLTVHHRHHKMKYSNC